MFHSRPKVFELNLRILGSHHLMSKLNLLVVILKESGLLLVHLMILNSFALPPTRITLPYPCQKSLQRFTHLIIIIWSFGTLSTNFFLANQHHNFHPPLILNLYQSCSHPSSQSSQNSFCSQIACYQHLTSHRTYNHIPTDLTFFSPATEDEICKLLSQSLNTFCDLDHIPTSLMKHCLLALLPTIAGIVNLSLSSGVLPKQFKLCSVIPFLKKYNLDKEYLSNYRPISHKSFLSKLTQRVVKLRLTHHLSPNDLLNSFQSAYTKYHSTESTLLSVLDHIIKAMSQQKITALCLLDLPAAFDTIIDQSILTHRLSSWFGLKGTVLSWLQSYLILSQFHFQH